jgi:hypothetical protein
MKTVTTQSKTIPTFGIRHDKIVITFETDDSSISISTDARGARALRKNLDAIIEAYEKLFPTTPENPKSP